MGLHTLGFVVGGDVVVVDGDDDGKVHVNSCPALVLRNVFDSLRERLVSLILPMMNFRCMRKRSGDKMRPWNRPIID